MNLLIDSLPSTNIWCQSHILECPVHIHEEIIRVCMHNNCKNLLLCYQCLNSHSTHTEEHESLFISFSKFNEILKNGIFTDEIKNFTEKVLLIEKKMKLLKEFENLNKFNINKDLQMIKDNMIKQINVIFDFIEIDLNQKSRDLNGPLMDNLKSSYDVLNSKILYLNKLQFKDNTLFDHDKLKLDCNQLSQTFISKIRKMSIVKTAIYSDKKFMEVEKFLNNKFMQKNCEELSTQNIFCFYDETQNETNTKFLDCLKSKICHFLNSIQENFQMKNWPKPVQLINTLNNVKSKERTNR